MEKAKIREIFLSIQGEGPYIGQKQLFIRFCKCNLNCKYCDTDFDILKSVEFSAQALLEKVNSYGKNLTLSLTGGEPLISVKFLEEFLPLAKQVGHRIYLETNGTLPENLKMVINYVDIVSADIKLNSATGLNLEDKLVNDFFEIAKEKETFAKIVFDDNIKDDEIFKAVEVAEKFDIEIILQPKMSGNNFAVSPDFCEKILNRFLNIYGKVRLIPQMHKFLNVR